MPAKSIAPISLAALTRASGSSRLRPGVGEGAEENAEEEEEGGAVAAAAAAEPEALILVVAALRTSAEVS
jgi:hypothetical protein